MANNYVDLLDFGDMDVDSIARAYGSPAPSLPADTGPLSTPTRPSTIGVGSATPGQSNTTVGVGPTRLQRPTIGQTTQTNTHPRFTLR